MLELTQPIPLGILEEKWRISAANSVLLVEDSDPYARRLSITGREEDQQWQKSPSLPDLSWNNLKTVLHLLSMELLGLIRNS